MKGILNLLAKANLIELSAEGEPNPVLMRRLKSRLLRPP